MFNKTRNRLVVFNAIVFFILLNILGAIMYVTTESRLFHQVNENLNKESLEFSSHKIRDLLQEQDFQLSRPLSIIVWDDDFDLMAQVPHDQFNTFELKKMQSIASQKGYISVNTNSHNYRVLNENVSGGTIQFIYNIEEERKVLDTLLFTIVIMDILSIIVSLLIGFLLANQALIPIKRAWDKQQQFVSDASHELRTPLTVLKVQLERLFRHPSHTIENESEKISIMIDETTRMSKLVSDLLTLARTDTDHIEIMNEPIDLQKLLIKIKNEFQDIALLKNIQLDWYTDQAIKMMGDNERLHQLFVILIDNALKYTEEGGTINVSCVQSGKMVKIVVEDTGMGIPKEDLPHIFDRFYRVNKSRSRSEGGTGLGLSIAKWIVEAHHGSIHAESTMDKGSRFIISFPLT